MSMTVDVAPVETLATLRVLGEPLRWEIVRRLAVEDLCTCHLVEELGTAQPLVSHHLRVLREAGIVRTEPCGSFTYYILERAVLADLASVVAGLGTAPRGKARRRPCS
jgi:ArsR family transcriptional regulator, arsenate/arsenite/antimonite-responsive transcriptional repressor